MYREIKIGDKTVPMLAMASVNVYYKRVFGEDPLIKQGGKEEMSAGEAIDLYIGMGFIMAKMAEGNREQMKKLNEDQFLDWLDSFDNADMLEAVPEISALYNGQGVPNSEKKTEDDR